MFFMYILIESAKYESINNNINRRTNWKNVCTIKANILSSKLYRDISCCHTVLWESYERRCGDLRRPSRINWTLLWYTHAVKLYHTIICWFCAKYLGEFLLCVTKKGHWTKTSQNVFDIKAKTHLHVTCQLPFEVNALFR